MLGSGEISAYFNASQRNLRQDFKEGKKSHLHRPGPPAPWKFGLSFLKTDILGHRKERECSPGIPEHRRQEVAPLGGCSKGCGMDRWTHRHSALLAALPSPSTCRLPAPSLWHVPLRMSPAQGCPGRHVRRAGIQMRVDYSAGGPVGDVIPQRLLWIPSQPRPGKLGAGGVSPKEEEGQGQWMKPLIFR